MKNYFQPKLFLCALTLLVIPFVCLAEEETLTYEPSWLTTVYDTDVLMFKQSSDGVQLGNMTVEIHDISTPSLRPTCPTETGNANELKLAQSVKAFIVEQMNKSTDDKVTVSVSEKQSYRRVKGTITVGKVSLSNLLIVEDYAVRLTSKPSKDYWCYKK